MDWIAIAHSPMPTGHPILVTDGETYALWQVNPCSGTPSPVGCCMDGDYYTWDFRKSEVTHWAELPALRTKKIVALPEDEVKVQRMANEIAATKWETAHE